MERIIIVRFIPPRITSIPPLPETYLLTRRFATIYVTFILLEMLKNKEDVDAIKKDMRFEQNLPTFVAYFKICVSTWLVFSLFY